MTMKKHTQLAQVSRGVHWPKCLLGRPRI